MKRKSIYLFLFFLVLACASIGVKSIDQMSGKERATFFMNIYNSQVADYRALVAMGNLTEDQKEILRIKRRIMVEVYPLIETYNVWVDNNAQPSVELEAQIIDLLNRMTAQVINQID